MSSLILPKDLANPILENNLKIFFTRYPHERDRLESILRKPAPAFPLIQVEVPSAPSKPPIRIILLCGIVNPQFLALLLNDKTVQKENFKLFIFEQNPEFAAWCFQNADLTQILAFQKTEWFICHDYNSVKPALFRALKPESVTAQMLNVQTLEVAEGSTKEIQEFYANLPALYNETAGHVIHNHGNLDDSLLGVEVTIRNKDYLLNNPGIEDLKDHYKGASALIVGAGPSLDQNLETIKKYNDRFVIIAADAALKPLTNAGIRVDFVTSIERLNAYQIPFFTDLEKTNADLIAFPVLHPDVLKAYPGNVRIVYRNYGFYAYFQKAWPKGILRCGGSTSHLAVRLADYFGCRRAFFVGLDSCYEEKDGLYRSHCAGTGHPDWGQFIELSEFNKTRRHQPPMQAVNNLGQPAITNITYYQWIKEYAEELAYMTNRMAIKNCSATGLRISGIPYVPLEEAAKDLDVNFIEKPQPPAVTFNRAWDNKELSKNLKGWLALCEDGMKEAEELLKPETVDESRFNALLYVYNFRLMIDDLFVAFVVQCAARRFFEVENKWWSLSLDFTTELPEKTEVLRQRFSLFREALIPLIAMFEEGFLDGE
jgi:hypothetical protein